MRGDTLALRPAHEPTLPGKNTVVANVRSAAEAVNPALERLVKPLERKVHTARTKDPTEGLNAAEQGLQALGLISVENVAGHRRALRNEIVRLQGGTR